MNDGMQQNEAQMAPHQHAQRIAQMIQEAQYECRADIERVDDPKAQALFEPLAEVLGGAVKALNDYRGGTERVWQETGYTARAGTRPPAVTDMMVDASEPPPRLTEVMPHPERQQKP